MKIYDSSNFPVVAVAVGATVLLTAVSPGTAVPDKALSQTGSHMTFSNSVLEFSGDRLKGSTSTVTLSGVTGTDSLTIGSKTYVGGTDFAIGGNDAATAVNLAAAINTRILEAQPTWLFNYENLNIDAKVVGTGAVAATVDIEHSLNGVDWSVLVALNPSGTTSAVVSSAQSKPKPFLRVKPNTLTGTGAVLTVSISPAP